MKDSSGLSPEQRRAIALLLEKRDAERRARTTIPRIPNREDLPLSFAQQRLWFLDKLEGENAVYHIPMSFRLKGAIDIDALRRALAEVERRHEALRTVFTTHDARPVQSVLPPSAQNGSYSLPITDLSHLEATKRELEVQRIVDEEAITLFDLTRGPLMRAGLLVLGPNEHVLLVSLHHIVFDGWSLGVFSRELSALYNAFAQRQPSPLAELEVQYPDFAVWQRATLTAEKLAGHLEYWRENLAGLPAKLDLPSDRPRRAVQRFEGRTHTFDLDPELMEKVRALSRASGTTLFMTLLSAYAVLLSRLSGEEDLAIGSPIANRTHRQTEPMIGCFINTIVLRTRPLPAKTFRAFLAEARQTALGAYAHQDLPFEQLIEKLQPERSLSHSPIFQVMFILQNAPWTGLQFNDVKSEGLRPSSERTMFDLTLTMREWGGATKASFQYNRDLFDAETIARFAGHFTTLLAGIVAAPDRELRDLPLLSEAERRRLLYDFNDTRVELPQEPAIHRMIAEQAEKTPERIALSSGERSLTYRQLIARARKIGNYLRGRGIAPGSLIGICLHRGLDLVPAILGVLEAGCAYVPLDPDFPPERLAFMRDDSKMTAILTEERLRSRIEGPASIISLDAERQAIDVAPSTDLSSKASTAYVIYTSGSTGRPKGVEIRHRSVANFLWSMQKQPGFAAEDVLLAVTTISFDIAGLELFLPLISGGRVVIASREQAADAAALLDLIERSKPTVMQATPATWRMLLLAGWMKSPSLRIFCGGEALSSELARELLQRGRELHNLYGPTETTVWSAHQQVTEADLERAIVPIGRPIDNTTLHVLDARLEPVPIGVAGELYIGGEGVAAGYLGRPELNAQKFVRVPALPDRLYKTGDLARRLPDGRLEFLGRADLQVKLRGFRIELGEIEAVLARHEALSGVVVTVREDTPGDQRLTAYYTVKAPVEVDALRALAKERLPEYMVPSVWVKLDVFPLTPNAKVDRRALPKPDRGPSAPVAASMPNTPVQELLAIIFGQVLRRDQIGVDDDFFALGGHSLLATQLLSRIRESFRTDLPLRAIFESPTIAALEKHLDPTFADRPARAAIEPIPRSPGDRLELSFSQQRIWVLDRFEGDTGVYNIPIPLRVSGPLDLAVLDEALRLIVARHEALRTTYHLSEGSLTQRIEETPAKILEVIHLEGMTAESPEIRQRLGADALRPFDLEREPPIRALAIVLGQAEHVVLLTVHHIAADGWSIGILFRELSEAYAALREKITPELSALPIQYVDFAAWQRRHLGPTALAPELDYWQRQLAGAPVLLALPTDRPRPAVQRFRGRTLRFLIEPELTAKVKKLAAENGATLFMTLLSTFSILLARLSREEDLTIGSPIANRLHSRTEGLIGCFINTIVMRTRPAAEKTFRELVAEVKQTAFDAYAHQDLPFEQLIEKLQPERSLSHSPIFQVMFILQNALRGEIKFAGTETSGLRLRDEGAMFDLTLAMEETRDGLTGALQYDVDLFDAETIERMAGYFRTLLEGIVATPDRAIGALPLLSAAERLRLLFDFNATRVEFPTDQTIHGLIAEQAARTPDTTAISFGNVSLSYAELEQRAQKIAGALRARGIAPGSLVGICLSRGLELVPAMLGVLYANCAYVPLDPDFPEERLAFMRDDSKMAAILTQEKLRARVGERTQILSLDGDRAELDSAAPLTLSGNGEDRAYVIYTSGSTGRPKGVEIRHRSAVNFLLSMLSEPGLSPDDVLLAVTTISFDIAALELFLPLICGARVVIASREEAADGAALLALIEGSQATVMQATPATWRMLLLSGWSKTPNLRVFCGGEALTSELARELLLRAKEVHNLYGPTETTIWSAHQRVAGIHLTAATVPIGYPIANTTLHVLDPRMEPAPIGVPGELYIGGEGVAAGYLGRAELTAEKFLHVPAILDRLYRTGDLARRLPDGRLEFLGRADFQVKLRGFRIELGEIEAQLMRCSAVAGAVVTVREDSPGDQRLTAYYTVREGEAVEAGELRELIRLALPEYMVPSAWVKLEAFPLTPNAKIDRRALPKPQSVEPAAVDAESLPKTQTQQILAGIFCQVLRRERVGIHEDFFALGGHSLLATQLMSRIRERFSAELPLRAIFESPTIHTLELRIDPLIAARPPMSPIEPVSRRDDLPLSFPQQRIWFLDRFEGDTGVYNIPIALHVAGELDLLALEEALRTLVRRHESLRTTFPILDGTPVQRIQEVPETILEIVQRHGVSAGSPELLKELTAEGMRAFDLSRSIPLRARVYVLDAQIDAADITPAWDYVLEAERQTRALKPSPSASFVLLLTVHHIAADGWSIGILFRELSLTYQALARGSAPQLPHLPIQYADFAAWQRRSLGPEALAPELDYWQQQLAGAPVLIGLSTDRPRPAIQRYHGRTLRFAIERELTAKLKALASDSGATLFMTLLSAFSTLLARLSGEEDLTIGSPIANRMHSQTEGLIGCFINTIVLRTKPSAEKTFRELLAEVKQTSLDAYANQDLPFEQLIEKLQPERSLSHSPIFQVMFILQNAAPVEISLAGTEVSAIRFREEGAMFDLTLMMEEARGGLTAALQYDVDLFDDDTIARVAGYFRTLLQGIVAAPDEKISRISILAADERRRLLGELNDTRAPLPAVQTVHGLIAARQHTDTPALSFEGRSLTHAELHRYSRRIAHELSARGIAPGSLVGICLERGLNTLPAMLGVMAAGCAYVPLDPDYPADRLAFMRDDSQMAAIVCEERTRARIAAPQGLSIISLDGDRAAIEAHPSTDLPDRDDPQSLAYVIYTSGSTGRPKGVEIRHRSVVNLLASMQDMLRLEAADVLLAVTTISFDIAALELFLPPMIGARIELAGRQTAADARALIELISSSGATVMQATPATWRLLISAGWTGSERLTALTGGEAIPLELARALSTRVKTLYNVYGPTETTIWSTASKLDAAALARDGAVIDVGRPIHNTRAYVLDRARAPVPPGVAGDLYLGGIGVARGYLGRPELTAAAFSEDPFAAELGLEPQLIYRTGDRARWTKRGVLELFGRGDDQVKVRGFRVELGEIESALATHPGVRGVAVIAAEDAPGEKRLVAFIAARDSLDPAVLREHARKTLPDYMVPSLFVAVENIPLTPNGKIDRRALAASALGKPTFESAGARRLLPKNATERRLLAIYEEVLAIGPGSFGTDRSFFDLGGHSLLAVKLIDRVEKGFGKSLPLMTLFRAPSVRELAAIIEGDTTVAHRALEEIKPAGSKPPLFFIGSTLYARKVAALLPEEQPLYGLNIFGLPMSGEPRPRVDVASVASQYLEEIRDTQPEGPYRFAAYCADAKLALEIAYQVHQSGERVALMACIDTIWMRPPPLGIRGLVLNTVEFGPGYLAHKAKRRLKYWSEQGKNALRWLETERRRAQGRPLSLHLQHTWLIKAYVEAMVTHPTPPFDGRIDVFMSHELRLKFPREIAQLARGGVEIHDVPGYHDQLFSSPNIEVLAASLQRRLDNAE